MPDVPGFDLKDFVTEAAGMILIYIFEQQIEWGLFFLKTVIEWWLVETSAPYLTGEEGSVLRFVRYNTNWLTALLAFIGFLVASLRVAIRRRGEPFRESLSHFFQLAVIILLGTTAVNLVNVAGDEYSVWIIEQADPDGNLIDDLDEANAWSARKDSRSVILALGPFLLISSITQLVLMLLRSGLLIVLMAIIPVLAAARFSRLADVAFKKTLAWLISFIVYKPTAATVYAVAVRLLNSEHESDHFLGIALFAGAVFTLPAILRAVNPLIIFDNGSPVRVLGSAIGSIYGSTAVNVGKGTSIFGASSGSGPRRRSNREHRPPPSEVPSPPPHPPRPSHPPEPPTDPPPPSSPPPHSPDFTPGRMDRAPADHHGRRPASSRGDGRPMVPPGGGGGNGSGLRPSGGTGATSSALPRDGASGRGTGNHPGGPYLWGGDLGRWDGPSGSGSP